MGLIELRHVQTVLLIAAFLTILKTAAMFITLRLS